MFATARFLLGLLLVLAAIQTNTAADKPLYLSVVLSYGRYGYNSSGAVPSFDLALQHIAEMGVLPGYRLLYGTILDSECDRGASLDAFFKEFHNKPTKIAIVGCGCSVATEPVAEISHRWNVSQISIASALSSLGDRTRFKSLFRMYPTFKNFAPAVVSILNHYNWKRAAVPSQNLGLFNKVFTITDPITWWMIQLYTDVEELLEDVSNDDTDQCCFSNSDIDLLKPEFDNSNESIHALKDVFERNGNYRIFLMNTYADVARDIMCEAAKKRLSYPSYAWILYGWYPEDWWASDTQSSCTNTEMEAFIEQARPLVVQQYPTPDDLNGFTISGFTAAQHRSLYINRVNGSTYTANFVMAGLSYDTMWAVALALNKTQEMVYSGNISETGCEGTSGELVNLDSFNYSNALMGCLIRWNLEQTDFTGVVGNVRFDETGTIIQDKVRLLQYRRVGGELKRVRIGLIDRNNNFSLRYEVGENDTTAFPNGIPPDGTPEQVVHTYHLALTIIYDFIASIGIIFGIVCLLFNCVFRQRKVIQMTSPKLNYFIIGGALLMFTAVYVGVMPSTDETEVHVQCILNDWLYVTGYLLVFGTILAKTWRVYHIFHNPARNKTKIQDYHLASLVLVVTGIGLLLVLAKSIAQSEPPYLVQDKEDKEGNTDLGVQEEYYIYECYDLSSTAAYLDILIFAYLALLQVIGIVLAFQTRKVKISALNDSKFVAVLIYTSSIVLVVLFLFTLLLNGYINIQATIFYGGILIMAATFLLLMFVPKMVNLYLDPQGEKIFNKSNPTANQGSVTPVTLMSVKMEPQESGDALSLLQERVREQGKAIEAKDEKIKKLAEELHALKNHDMCQHPET